MTTPSTPNIDLNPHDLAEVQRIFKEYVPQYEVWAFGSRVTWTAKAYSDLDLAIITDKPLSLGTLADLKNAFDESDLSIKVDLVDWATTGEAFRKIIKKTAVVVQNSYENMVVLERAFGELYAEPTRNGLTRPKAVRGSGVKMVNMGELFAHPRLLNAPMDRVPLSDSETERFLLKDGDLLFARQSLVLEGAGKCSIFLHDNEPVTFESHVTRVRLDQEKGDPNFYFYYFQSHHGQSAIRSIVEQGAGASGVRGSDLEKLNVLWRPIKEQRAIAHILGTLDDKIELNRRMNETLEAMARALFKSWFVDFEPVRAKVEGRDTGLPKEIADLFPDSFEDSELGEVPKGWRVASLGDVADNIRRNIQPDDIPPSTPYIGLEHMPRRCIALSDWGEPEELESNKHVFKRGEMLFGKLRPYFHKMGVAAVDGVCSTDIVVIAPKKPEWFGFTLGHISSVEFVDYTNAGSTGTKMPRTSWNEMARYTVVLPAVNIADRYTGMIRPMVDQIAANIHESRTLAAQRDALLPRLLSGEIQPFMP